MRRLLWLLLLLAPCFAHAQVVGPGFVDYVTSAPSGACSQGQHMQQILGSGDVYTCASGTWAKVAGSGACATCVVANPGADQTITGAHALILSNTGSSLQTKGAGYIGGRSPSFETFVGAFGSPAGSVFIAQESIPAFGLFVVGNGSSLGELGLAGGNGTLAAPTQTNNLDFISEIDTFGFRGDTSAWAYAFSEIVQADGDWTGGNHKAKLTWATNADPTVPFMRLDQTGLLTPGKLGTLTNCANGASPAVCAAAASGVVAVPTGTNPTLQINTTAVTASSRIFLGVDESATIAATTCNTTLSTLVQPVVTARSAGVSFTIQIGAVIAANPACVSYFIVN